MNAAGGKSRAERVPRSFIAVTSSKALIWVLLSAVTAAVLPAADRVWGQQLCGTAPRAFIAAVTAAAVAAA